MRMFRNMYNVRKSQVVRGKSCEIFVHKWKKILKSKSIFCNAELHIVTTQSCCFSLFMFISLEHEQWIYLQRNHVLKIFFYFINKNSNGRRKIANGLYLNVYSGDSRFSSSNTAITCYLTLIHKSHFNLVRCDV